MGYESIGASADRKNQLMSLVAGFLIAGLGFALLLTAMAYLLPLFDRFEGSPSSRLLAPIAILFISVSGLRRYLRHDEKRVQTPVPAERSDS
jgi:hypothetical protein